MSIELCVLASGSAGNATVVRTGAGGAMLIDAGIGPRTTAKRLDGTGVCVRDIAAICLTHLDSDHLSATWLGTILNRGIRIFCHRRKVQDVLERFDHEAVEPLIDPFDHAFEPLPGLRVRAVPLAHDSEGSHGLLLDGFDCRVGYATDLVHVSAALRDLFF